jgi:hypothetical protein
MKPKGRGPERWSDRKVYLTHFILIESVVSVGSIMLINMADEGEVKLTDTKRSSDYITTCVDRLSVAVDSHQREIRVCV